mmetsp:Transcript_85541/g.151420  ORF Transcript_85541/g.151420 Transcript_85541/m.151420 type:complete len:202 (+) Transcript_85541:663-1268(+)
MLLGIGSKTALELKLGVFDLVRSFMERAWMQQCKKRKPHRSRQPFGKLFLSMNSCRCPFWCRFWKIEQMRMNRGEYKAYTSDLTPHQFHCQCTYRVIGRRKKRKSRQVVGSLLMVRTSWSFWPSDRHPPRPDHPPGRCETLRMPRRSPLWCHVHQMLQHQLGDGQSQEEALPTCQSKAPRRQKWMAIFRRMAMIRPGQQTT